MLTAVYEDFVARNIVSAADIIRFREYIHKTYPNFASDSRDAVLASILLRIIDRELNSFDHEQKALISNRIFIAALKRSPFLVCENDIFVAALYSALFDRQVIGPLTTWVNTRQDTLVSEEMLAMVVDLIRADRWLADGADDWAVYFGENDNYMRIRKILHTLDQKTGLAVAKPNHLSVPEVLPIRGAICLGNEPEQAAAQQTGHASDHSSLEPVPEEMAGDMVLDQHLKWSGPPFPHSVDPRRVTGPSWAVQVMVVVLVAVFSMLPIWLLVKWYPTPYQTTVRNELERLRTPIRAPVDYDLPQAFLYRPVDTELLKSYLQAKNSALVLEPYFSAIMDTGKAYNLNPLLLFAITGQEQGFVPRDSEGAFLIVNNPFNVYGSWKKYNTTIDQSAKIAAITIIELSKDRPLNVEPLAWLNREYAQDPEWSKGVLFFLQDTERALKADSWGSYR